MRIFTLPPASTPEPNFYDSLQKVRLRQQLEMYSLCKRVHLYTNDAWTLCVRRPAEGSGI